MDNKKLKVLICEPLTPPRVAEIDATLEQEQEIVGGFIDVHYPPAHHDETCLIINDEGKIEGLPPNRPVFDEDGKPYDVIAGTFIVVGAPADSDEFASLTDAQVEKYAKMYAPLLIPVGEDKHGTLYACIRPAA